MFLLLEELGPEVRQSEDLFEEDVVLGASLWPLVKLVHQLHMACEVVDGLHLQIHYCMAHTRKTAVDQA